jgi:hypothetical protein
MAKPNGAMWDVDAALGLLKKNGVDMGNCLLSRFSVSRIVEHIFFEIRKPFIQKYD